MSKQEKRCVAWVVMYIICAVYGFIPAQSDFMAAVGVVLALAFFIPPAMLLHYAVSAGKQVWIRRILKLSIASLALSLVFLVLNFLSLYFPIGAGTVVYFVLILVSVPMICGQFWLLGLFGWACLMMVCLQELLKLRKQKQEREQKKAEKNQKRSNNNF